MDSRSHLPTEDSWHFDQSVVNVFDDMLRRSIPQYDVMRDLTSEVACPYVRDHTDVIDLGCSKGEALYQVRSRVAACNGLGNRYVGVEGSHAMYEAAKQRSDADPDVLVVNEDLKDFSMGPYRPSLALSVLTLQFVPISYRARILADVYAHLCPGGALVMVEKVLGSTDSTNNVLVQHYHAYKQSQGYSSQAIARKAKALEGVLVPITPKANETLLQDAGFDWIECFWRYLSFAAWLAVKSP